MSKTRNLLKRGNIFYGRIAVPNELRALRASVDEQKNPKEITRSLVTPDRKQAEYELAKFKVEMQQQFDRDLANLRSKGARPRTLPASDDLARVREEFLLDELTRDEDERARRKSPAELEKMREDVWRRLGQLPSPPATPLELLTAPGVLELQVAREAAEWSSEKRRILKEELQKHLTQSQYVLVSDVIEEAGRVHGLDLTPDSFAYKTLGRGLIKEWLKALDVAERRDRGVYNDDAHLPQAAAVSDQGNAHVIDIASKRSERPVKSKSMSAYLDTYMKEQKAHLNPSDQMNLRATIRQFVECNGELPIADYGKNEMVAYKKGLRNFPTNATKLYPGTKFKEIIRRQQTDQHATLSSNTIRGKLSSLAVFGKWLEENVSGVDATNFTTSLPKRDDRERMEPFSLDEVRRILNSLAFIGCEAHNNYQKPGAFKVRDWRYWLTLIAAFTGARLNEIVQMDIEDVRNVDGIWAFDITNDDGIKSLKTKSSKRLVPVHQQLIDLGLLTYRDGLIARGATSLFHYVSIGNDGRRSGAAGGWFRRFLAKIGVKQKGDLGGSHRSRHTIADAMRRGAVDEYNISATLGHQVDIARMTGEYGREMKMTLANKAEHLAKVAYPGVDFDLLR